MSSKKYTDPISAGFFVVRNQDGDVDMLCSSHNSPFTEAGLLSQVE